VWDSSFELGVDGSEGNATTLTFRSGANLRRKVGWSDLKLAITYVKSTAEEIETKHNAQLEANHDWLLGESPWTLFAKTILVYDEFRPFDLELTLNTGIGYQFVDTDVWTFTGRFGSGATRQWDGPRDNWRPEAMLGADVNCRISDRQKLYAKSEYYPQWGEFEVYRVRTDAGWELLLDEATNMSLKVGVIDRYDSNAGGTKPNALDYSVLLLWKL
jgi:putative salt-induced outer membrane protein YdiY